MGERPIIFSAPMVRALLDGRKTQTRRIIKSAPISACPNGPLLSFNHGVAEYSFGREDQTARGLRWWRCPYGQPGDTLWVRENWTHVPASAYRMSEGVQQTVNPSDHDMAAIYAAGWDRSIPKWRPSIHMPRWASRLTLEVTDVRVQRLQDISREDAASEGLVKLPASGRYTVAKGDQYFGAADHDPRVVFGWLWKSIHGEGSWATNPWVWAVSFRPLSQPQSEGQS